MSDVQASIVADKALQLADVRPVDERSALAEAVGRLRGLGWSDAAISMIFGQLDPAAYPEAVKVEPIAPEIRRWLPEGLTKRWWPT